MRKKIRLVLCFIITVSLALSIVSNMGTMKRVEAANNPYSGGYSNCTWTAWQYCYESTGHALPGWSSAGSWLNSARNSGYTTSTTPRANSIAVWQDGGNGHVAWVTNVNGNQIYVKEGGFVGSGDGRHEGWVSVTELRNHGTQRLAGFIYIGSLNKDPIGSFDNCVSTAGKIRVTGWAFDPDSPSASIAVHIYVGGPAGSSSCECYGIDANKSSPDVNKVYGISGNHRFDVTIPVIRDGVQTVYAYAINTTTGNNPVFGTKTISIIKDNEKPVISTPVVSNIDSSGYTVTCTVSDNAAVKEVWFPSWSKSNGQDDIYWYKGTINGNIATARILASKHGVGEMLTHIYAYDLAGNNGFGAVNNKVIIPCKTHTNVVVDKGVIPSCTTDGLTEGCHCTSCGTVIKEQTIIPAKGHIIITDPAVEPTTTSTGLTEGSHCSVCGKILKEQTIIPRKEKEEANETENINKTSGGDASKSNNDKDETDKGKPVKLYSNEWINGKWYDSNGNQTYSGTLQWKNNATGWWVEDTSGWYPTNQWQKIDGVWYFFKPDGYMASNEYYNGYWFNADGSWDDKYLLSWKSNATGWWVEDKSGWWPSSSWLKIDGYWYYFNASGYMVTSQYVDGWWISADGVCY